MEVLVGALRIRRAPSPQPLVAGDAGLRLQSCDEARPVRPRLLALLGRGCVVEVADAPQGLVYGVLDLGAREREAEAGAHDGRPCRAAIREVGESVAVVRVDEGVDESPEVARRVVAPPPLRVFGEPDGRADGERTEVDAAHAGYGDVDEGDARRAVGVGDAACAVHQPRDLVRREAVEGDAVARAEVVKFPLQSEVLHLRSHALEKSRRAPQDRKEAWRGALSRRKPLASRVTPSRLSRSSW